MYVRKGVNVDRNGHANAIRFSGPSAVTNAMEFMRIMNNEHVQRSTVAYRIDFWPKCLANGIWHVRVNGKQDGNHVDIYGTEKEVRSEAEAIIRGYLADTATKTDNFKGMQRKIAAQAKEIARLKRANEDICKVANEFQAARREEQKRHAAQVDLIRAHVAQSRPSALPATAWASLEARVAKLEAAARPSTGPIVIDGAEADGLGLRGLQRHANVTGRPVHVLGPSRCHTGRIVEPQK